MELFVERKTKYYNMNVEEFMKAMKIEEPLVHIFLDPATNVVTAITESGMDEPEDEVATTDRQTSTSEDV